ncbi:hypothetical protein EAF00_000447 [Botryotinia globosa]|nr:hypothetical protein EAF00_000447 [Botryotinia globosa]
MPVERASRPTATCADTRHLTAAGHRQFVPSAICSSPDLTPLAGMSRDVPLTALDPQPQSPPEQSPPDVASYPRLATTAHDASYHRRIFPDPISPNDPPSDNPSLAGNVEAGSDATRGKIADNSDYHDDFEESLADIFTTTNFETFVQTYFLQLHQFYPIVHRPTFDYETACLPLLLAIFLFGSLCSAPSDSTLSARKVFDVAEEYIFNHPTMQQLHHSNSTCVSPEETIGVLQAAFIIEVVQKGTNNVETRKRLRIKRHLLYIAALRSYGLFQVCGLAIWSFVIGSCFAIMFNSCALLTLGELSIDFPCRNDIFEAETAAEYEHLAMFDSPE